MSSKILDTPVTEAKRTLNTEGFVTSVPEDMKPPPFAVPRYKLARCAEHGGVRGYMLERRQFHHPKDGLFWEYQIKLTAPCPVVTTSDPKAEVFRAEPGTVVMVVLDDHVEELESYFADPAWCAEIAFVPVKKNGVWTIVVVASKKPVLRAALIATAK